MTVRKGLGQANVLRTNNNTSTGYGVVYADEVSGHRTVANLTALYALNDWQLSASGNNTDNDAIGQLWYVVNADGNGNGCYYQLKDWNKRNNAAGWSIADYTTKAELGSVVENINTNIATKANAQDVTNAIGELQDSIKNIAVTGGASTAAAVTFDNTASGMAAVNAQAAIDELSSKISEERTRVDGELEKKFAKANIAQELGNSEELVMSQKTVSDKLNGLSTEIIYDISAHNDDAVFESLQALLSSSNLSTLIPTSVRHGGMSIRFVQSSDNKYVQYRLTNQSWSINIADWQEIGLAEFSTGEKVSEVGIDNEPTAGSDNLITSGSVATIQKGNLKKKSGITTIDLSLSDFTLKYDLLATISNGHLVSNGDYRVYYKQMDVDSRIIYKLGASAIQGNAAIFVCDTIPAANVSFSNTVERVADATGSFNIQRGQYLCIQSYSTINTYLPAYLKKEYVVYESVNIFDELGEKAPDSTIKSDSVWGAIDEIEDKESANVAEIKKIVPFMVDTASFFWTHKQATNFNQDNPFKISGTANSNTLNVLSGGQTTSVLTSADKNASIVVKFDDGTCRPYMLTGWSADTLSIYPTIDKNITDGEVVPLMNDSQHLTIYGYHAYSQHLFEENPRYCEKNKYIKRYNGGMTSIRFSALSGTPNRYEASRNDNSHYSCQYGSTGIFIIPYTDYLTESQYGYQWEVSTKNIKGYVESYVGVCDGFHPANTFTLDEGYEIHIEGWIDGVKSYEKIKDNIFIERICIPFEKDDDKVKIKIYLTKMRNNKDTLYIGATTFWVNEINRTNMIELHEVVLQLFDSWGDYDATDYIEDEDGNKWYQGSSGKELQRLINYKNGIIIPYFNRSKGSMTTRWGKSWWYHNVWSIHPDIMLTDFGINDYHTNISQTFPNFKDPYGNIISMATPVTATEFYQNMETLFDMCIKHNIAPIYVMCSRIGCNINYINTFVNNHAQQLSLT